MGTQLDTSALHTLYADLGRDKEFIVALAEIYRLQAEEFLREIADGVSNDRLAGIAHDIAGSSSRLGASDFVALALDIETNAREGLPHTSQLETLLNNLPEIMVAFESFAQSLPDHDHEPLTN